MAMRALKSTTIQFGMVVMPVKVYPATQDKSVGMKPDKDAEDMPEV
jgi:non-homologous end joining protein Ku